MTLKGNDKNVATLLTEISAAKVTEAETKAQEAISS
jgi:hypothetical protein